MSCKHVMQGTVSSKPRRSFRVPPPSIFAGGETAVKTHNLMVRSSDALMNVPGDAVVTDVTGAVWPV